MKRCELPLTCLAIFLFFVGPANAQQGIAIPGSPKGDLATELLQSRTYCRSMERSLQLLEKLFPALSVEILAANASWKSSPFAVPLLFISTVLASASYSLFVASVARTPAATDIIGYLGVLLMAVLGGSIYPLPTMPDWVRTASELMITKWARVGFLSVFSGSGEDVFSSVFILLIIACSFFVLALAVLGLRRRNM